YPLSIEDVIIRSNEKNGICVLTHFVDEPSLKGEFNLAINVSEFKNIINAVNIKLSDYILGKLIKIKKRPLKTSSNEIDVKEFIEKLFQNLV
ncbi:MAG: hypothetical protein KJI71_05755, partial [Patescibacteria group bacterium]|nr:hypothetical protein [Patescibacteria group bacterium]